MRLWRKLSILALLGVLHCSTTAPGELDDDARESLATLTARLERTPPDAAAIEEAVAIYVAHGRFDDAEGTVRGALERSSVDVRVLERLARIYASIASEAERATREEPQALAEVDADALTRRAQAIAALARFRAQRDRAAVVAEIRATDGTARRLSDVMLECTNRDFGSEGGSTSSFAVSYFGDRLRVEAGGSSDPRGSEPRLGEIALLALARDPMGRTVARIEPYPWATETVTCASCRLSDACALVGDVAPRGGLTHVDLATVSEVRFRGENRP